MERKRHQHHLLVVPYVLCKNTFNPLHTELNTIYHLLALLEAHHILHISRIRVKNIGQVFDKVN